MWRGKHSGGAPAAASNHAPVRARALLAGMIGSLLIALTACVSIPEAGPVVVGPEVPTEFRQPRGQYYAVRPARDASAEDVVRGFLSAAADFTADHDVARAFLTNDKALQWRPLRRVVVLSQSDAIVVAPDPEDGASPSPSATPTTSLSASASALSTQPSPAAPGITSDSAATSAQSESTSWPSPTPIPSPGAELALKVSLPNVTARVDAEGRLVSSPPGDSQTLRMRLRAVAGQWRIAEVEDGIVLAQDVFNGTFTDVPLYYPDRTGGWLVPDPRWVPLTSSPTALVALLLRGPSPWLAPAVSPPAPVGTALSSAGVQPDGDTTVVDLNAAALQAQDRQRQLLLAQIQQTLDDSARLLPYLEGKVQLTVEGSGFEIPLTGAGPPASTARLLTTPEAASPVVLGQDNRLQRIKDGEIVPVPELAELGPDASYPAVSLDGTFFAVLLGSGTQLRLLSSSGEAATRVEAASLTPPSVDQYGWAWTAPSGRGTVFAVKQTERVELPLPWRRDYRVTSLRVSPEGARLIAVARQGEDAVVLLASIVRSEHGVPEAIAEVVQPVASDIIDVRSVDWLGDRQLVVLGRDKPTADLSVFRVPIGGWAVPLAPLAEGVAVTAGPSPYQVWAETPTGAVRLVGRRFDAIPGVRQPASPG